MVFSIWWAGVCWLEDVHGSEEKKSSWADMPSGDILCCHILRNCYKWDGLWSLETTFLARIQIYLPDSGILIDPYEAPN